MRSGSRRRHGVRSRRPVEASMIPEPTLSPHELRTPSTPETTGLPASLMEDIALRTVIAEGRPSMVRLAERLHTGVNVAESVVGALRDRRLMEYEGMDGRSYLLSVTDAGRDYIRRRSDECRYLGPLPVPVDLYTRVVRAQVPNLQLDRDQLSRAFGD